jgi:tetratricopeptide (TPR) repeat protein
MPETAKILPFPRRAQAASLSREDALGSARAYLGAPPEERAGAAAALSDADVLLSICALLREEANSDPLRVSQEASEIYRKLMSIGPEVGFFDERDYFLGESALIAGGTFRLLGHRDETELWLDRAEASFRHTLNPSPMLARVTYIRLALRYDMRRYDDVLELLPSVALTFSKLGMDQELSKCRFLEAVALKDLGRDDEAITVFNRLVANSEVRCEDGLRGMALVNLGDLHGKREAFELALGNYNSALPILRSTKRFIALADLKAMVGETLRRMGRVEASLSAYREAVSEYSALSATTRVAYLRVVLAEALLQAGRFKEAEWEIKAALPTIAEERMVPEGFAALNLLQESLQQRKADPRALGELREYLQAKN